MATVDRPSSISKFFRRLTASDTELEAEALQHKAEKSGCMPA